MLLFASDIHLAAHSRAAVAAFLGFLSGPVRRADRLYLLGDVFDLWLGDDDARAPHPRSRPRWPRPSPPACPST